MEKLISIIVTVYNKEIYLGHCFTLLNEQLLKLDKSVRDRIDLLIIDDCSTDCSIPMIRGILNSDIDYRFIRNKNRMNIAYVRWQAVNEALGKYFIFIDADDLIAEDYIESLLDLDLDCGADLFQFKGREYPNGVLMDYDSTWTSIKLIRTDFVRSNNINFNPTREAITNDNGGVAVVAEDLEFFNTFFTFNPVVYNVDKILVTWNFAVPDSLTKINYSYLNFISKP